MKIKNKVTTALLILALIDLWAELAVGIFFQDSWGGS
jgi:hypothetical protein